MQRCGTIESVRRMVRDRWGFETFRPLQEQAIEAAVSGRDTVVVIPTGGGKSLCYQAPAAARESGITVVVSPLIALMKDQVDALNARGIASALYNSSLRSDEKRAVIDGLHNGQFKLLYVAPERFPDQNFIDLLHGAGVNSIAIDEAHCISHWGHDFRPDYRKLSALRDIFPDTPIHAFTATATPRVRDDIAAQLKLNDPAFLVGNFDRANLTYRVLWRREMKQRIMTVLDRYADKGAGIIYCIRRNDVDELTASLRSNGYDVRPYHAGLSPDIRKANQEAFSSREANIIIATIAFGMGIDRPDIRFVLHTGMPQSIEAYQQETGRAGRDGLPAECVMFHTTADFMTWRAILEKGSSGDDVKIRIAQLEKVLDFCKAPSCRHRLLVEHFGQTYDKESCGACDACLGERDDVSDATVVAQKILSAIVRTGERYGAKYLADVLIGNDTDQVADRGHLNLSVFGLMSEYDTQDIRSWIDQLAAGGHLAVGEEYRTFSVTDTGWTLLRGTSEARLFADDRAKRGAKRERRRRRPVAPDFQDDQSMGTAYAGDGESELDAELYEALRKVRKELADERSVPAYCIFPNKTLEKIAIMKPTDEASLGAVPGIGPKKMEQYGAFMLECVKRFAG